MRTRAVDWDGTLVDEVTGERLAGAVVALVQLLNESRKVIVHSCRANWSDGRAQIETKLRSNANFRVALSTGRLTIEPKVVADDYIDNLGVRFDRSWPSTLMSLRRIETGDTIGRRAA